MGRVSEAMIEEYEGQAPGAVRGLRTFVIAKSAISRCSSQSEMLLS